MRNIKEFSYCIKILTTDTPSTKEIILLTENFRIMALLYHKNNTR